jgi:predicted  nucleic acid-binding Zn-ribbon protein
VDVNTEILTYFITQGPFAVLFVWLLYTSKKESKEREDRLMNHVEKTTETLDDIRDSLRDLRSEVDDIKLEIRKDA